jgi:hypothetical protein
MNALPIPSAEYFPKLYRDANDPQFVALTDKLDSIYGGMADDIKNFRRLRRIEMLTRPFADGYGHQVSANILSSDSDRQARSKAYYATRSWGNRGTWLYDAKSKVDAIAGGNSSLLTAIGFATSDTILVGGLVTEPTDNYWSTLGINLTSPEGYYFDTDTDLILMDSDDGSSNTVLGTDGVEDFGPDLMAGPYFVGSGDPDLGMDLVGSGTEIQIPGNVYINVDNPFLTAEQIAQIVASLDYTTVPAYFRVFLCYLNDQGNPVVYAGGQIG